MKVTKELEETKQRLKDYEGDVDEEKREPV